MDRSVPESRVSTSRVWRAVCLVLGSVFLAVGTVGVVIPLLPTTPFLVLAALCYARGSVRCYTWLVGNRLFGRYLSDYLCGRGVSWRVKASALALLWTVISLSVILAAQQWWVRGLLLLIAAAVTVHVAMLKGRSPDE